MAAIENLTEGELYLAAIFDDPSGIELAEFLLVDEEKKDGCFRVWPMQWTWYRNESTYQIDHAGRALGKSVGIRLRALAFPFCHPGQEMLITAPELNHLRPVTDKIEHDIMSIRLLRELLPGGRSNGINRQPQFQVHFRNNSRIVSRLPNRDGRGVKGQHPLVIEMDECFPAGTLVTTRRGQVPIELIRIGDEVWTHRNRWKRVTQIFNRGERDAISLRGQGHPGLVVTPDHKFWARPLSKSSRSRGNNWGAVPAESPEWMSAGELPNSALWGSPVSVTDTWPSSVPRPRMGPGVSLEVNQAFMRMAGWYLAEGSTQPSGKINFSVHVDEVDEIQEMLADVGLKSWASKVKNSEKCMNVVTCHAELARFFTKHFGRGAHRKQVPSWAMGMPPEWRQALLDAVVAGDGFSDPDVRYAPGRWKLTTVSKALAISVRLLALGLGYHVSLNFSGPRKKPAIIRGREVRSDGFYQVVGGTVGQIKHRADGAWVRVKEAKPAGLRTMFDLEVEGDHSFVADGIFVHNSQDYPPAGWIEIIETMKAGTPGAQWRCHGVSRGVRDNYYKYTQGEDPDLPFYVHRYMAMHRPDWSPEERKAKIAIYGGTEDNVDYRRNVYGDHGDATNPLFVLARLMKCVQIDQSTWAAEYNDSHYYQCKINDELLSSSGAPIESFLQMPHSHLDEQYVSFWGGLDVGFTRDPSELLIFGELKHPKQKGKSLFRLLARIHLMRISAANQARVVRAVFDFYGERLRRFSMDKTGNGLPLWQELDPEAVGTHVEDRRTPQHISQRIKGYGFSEKVAVEFDDRELKDNETARDAVIQKNVVSFASDELRKLVDTECLELPYDREVLTEWQGQEIQYVRDEGSAAGLKTKLVGGSLHTLDAAFMCFAGRALKHIEEALKVAKKPDKPVLARFGM